jgi:hypothetical protein
LQHIAGIPNLITKIPHFVISYYTLNCKSKEKYYIPSYSTSCKPVALSCITVTAAMAVTATGTLNHQYPFSMAQKSILDTPIQCMAATKTTAKPANKAANSSHELRPDTCSRSKPRNQPNTTHPKTRLMSARCDFAACVGGASSSVGREGRSAGEVGMVEGIAELIWLLMFAAVCSAREGEGRRRRKKGTWPFLELGTRYSGMGLS